MTVRFAQFPPSADFGDDPSLVEPTLPAQRPRGFECMQAEPALRLMRGASNGIPQARLKEAMAAQPLKRNLYAILAADVAGFSRVMGENEEDAFRILRAHRAVTDSIIELHGGRIFNTAGDSVLAAFESPVEAVRAAIEIQDAIGTRNLSLPENSRLAFRIGLNLGDVIIKDDDLLGDAVNVAARLESQAEPGGLCISGTMYDQIVGKLDLQFEAAGELTLKNIQRPVRAYTFGGSGAGPSQTQVPSNAVAKKSRVPFFVSLAATSTIIVAGGFLLFSPELTIAPSATRQQPAAASPAATRSPFDGTWSGSWCPRAFQDREAFCAPRVLRVSGGRLEMESGQPGQPGYTKLSGTISAAGLVEILGTGVAGQPGGGRGLPFSVELRGRVQGEMMATAGKFQNGRDIEFNLIRTQR